VRTIASVAIAIITKCELQLYSILRHHQKSKVVVSQSNRQARPNQSEFAATGNAGYLGLHTHTEHSNYRDVGTLWLSQTVMRGPICIDREKFVECGGLDTESYFLAFDDHDLSLRAYLRHGYRVGYVPIGYRSEPRWGTTRKNRSLRQLQLAIYETLRISDRQKSSDLYALSGGPHSALPAPTTRQFELRDDL